MKKSRHAAPAILGLAVLLLIGFAAWQWQAADGAREVPARPDQKQPAPIQWRPASAAERQAAITSITNQLKAFKKDNYERAMFYQSSALKKNFPSAEAFREMIQSGYPPFANYRAVDFGQAHSDGAGRHMQIEVVVTGQQASRVRAVYDMVLEENIFRVEGVMGGTLARPAPMRPNSEGRERDPHHRHPREPGERSRGEESLFSHRPIHRHAPV